MVMIENPVYRSATTLEEQGETEMRLKLLSPDEMNEHQKKTYDESIASKRGKPPPPMMAWLNSPEMARHATRLGAYLRFDTLISGKTVRNRHTGHRAALDLALRVVCP
jgi:hypothetical protein